MHYSNLLRELRMCPRSVWAIGPDQGHVECRTLEGCCTRPTTAAFRRRGRHLTQQGSTSQFDWIWSSDISVPACRLGSAVRREWDLRILFSTASNQYHIHQNAMHKSAKHPVVTAYTGAGDNLSRWKWAHMVTCARSDCCVLTRGYVLSRRFLERVERKAACASY